MKEFTLTDEVLKAKTLLKGSATKTSNLYDEFGKLINKTLSERPESVIDLLESYIEDSEPTKTFTEGDDLNQTSIAENQIKLFNDYVRDDAGGEQEEEFEIPITNCLHMCYFFEQAGIGLSREEIFKISLAMKYLVYNYPLGSARFWGKIFGTEKCYYISEVEFREGEGEDEDIEEEEEDKPHYNEDDEINEDDGPAEENNLPVNSWKPPPPIMKEDHHSGANKFVYFVCNQLGDPWEKLPHVSPVEITAAKEISKFFTGHLNAEVLTYPPFPGEELNYLRAQIARISSSTLISPAGYFIFDDDEDEEEEDEIHESYKLNTEFEGLSVRELTDRSMSSWAHHSQYILPQGRCTWYNPYEKTEDDFEEEDEEEEENGLDPVLVPETGPNLLASVGDDKGMGHVSAWSTYASSQILPEYAVAVARSNIWPGAYAFAKETIFENVYIGWGKKYSLQTYAPPQPPVPLDEFPITTEIQEVNDPSVEEENALKEKLDADKAAEDVEEEELENDDDDD